MSAGEAAPVFTTIDALILPMTNASLKSGGGTGGGRGGVALCMDRLLLAHLEPVASEQLPLGPLAGKILGRRRRQLAERFHDRRRLDHVWRVEHQGRVAVVERLEARHHDARPAL